MKGKIKTQKGFIQIPLLLVFIASLIVSSVTAGGAFEYNKTSNLIKEAQQLSQEEKYSEANEKLGTLKNSWFVKTVGIHREKIYSEIEGNKKLDEDKSKYNQGLDELNKDNLSEAISVLSELPEDSFYYQKSQTKIEESKRKLAEGELAGEKVVRKEAQEKAQQETIRRTQEEAARIVAEGKTKQEEGARIVAEGKTRQEESARRAAEQRATSEQLAKEQQQRQTELQRQRAEQEEKAKVLELAKTNPRIKAIVSGELKFYIDPLPSYAATGVSDAVENIATAFSSINISGAQVRRVYNSNDADLTVAWVRDYGSHILGQAIFNAHLKVGLGSNNCVGSWSAFDADTVKKVLWHELGHSMGYGHSNNPNNVMYSETNTRFEVDHEISKVISGGWLSTIPLCGAGMYSYSFETDDPATGFDLFVLRPGVDPKSFSGESGRFYVGCGEKGMHRYPGSCTVEDGAQIYIENTSASDAIRLSGKIIDENYPSWPDMNWDQSVFQYDSNQLTKYWELFH